MNEIITLLLNEIAIPSSCALIGSIITAVFLRKNTSSEEFEKIKAGKYKEAIDILVENNIMTYSELYKINNFSKIAEKADAYIKNKNQNKNITFDWIMRFYDAVGNVSDEDLHDVWAKLLAGELDNPGGYSYKTIEALKNMNKNDAIKFKQICDSSIKDSHQVFLPNYDEYLKKRNINYVDIMSLNESGLMFNDGTISLNHTVTKDTAALFVTDNYVITTSSELQPSKIYVKEYPFTKAGEEIFGLLEGTSHIDNIIDLANEILRENKNLVVEVHKLIKIENDFINFEQKNLLED